MKQLAHVRLLEFRHYAAHVRVRGEEVNALENFAYEPLPDVRDAKVSIPADNSVQIVQS